MQASREAVLLLRSALGAARLASSNATKVVLQQVREPFASVAALIFVGWSDIISSDCRRPLHKASLLSTLSADSINENLFRSSICSYQFSLSPVQDVAKVGYAGEMVDVSKGFARNYLLPQRLASIVPKAKGKDAAGEAEAASTAPQREEVMDEAAEAKEAVRLLTASPLVRRSLADRSSPRKFTSHLFSLTHEPAPSAPQIIRAAVSRKTKKIMPIGRKQILAHVRCPDDLESSPDDAPCRSLLPRLRARLSSSAAPPNPADPR